ncbi:MAG: galactokinase [Gemmatimonadaceae bacterium]
MAFGRIPAVIASAPGRVNLIGEHTDYNGGEVLPIAIAQRTWVAMGPGATRKSRAVSAERGEVGEWDLSSPRADGGWWDYIAGSLEAGESLGIARRSRDVAVLSAVPMGSGLSSSAALEVATLTAACALDEITLVAKGIAIAAHKAENGYVGVASGIMDQFASALCTRDTALHIDCATQETNSVRFDRTVLIVDTATPRALRNSAFNQRRTECELALERLRVLDPLLPNLARATPALLEEAALPSPLAERARHVVTETARVGAFITALRTGGELGQLLNASHRSLRDDYQCSSPELDWVVEHTVARVGIDGARLTGAGWGGCAIVVGEGEALEELAPELAASFTQAWERAPHTWLTRASDGARVEFIGK